MMEGDTVTGLIPSFNGPALCGKCMEPGRTAARISYW